MKIDTVELAEGITRIILEGDLDIPGSQAINGNFITIARANKGVVVDLGRVGFVASIGIRTLLSGAKAIHAKGGKLVLLNASPAIERILKVTGVTNLMPLFGDLDAAIQAITP